MNNTISIIIIHYYYQHYIHLYRQVQQSENLGTLPKKVSLCKIIYSLVRQQFEMVHFI